MMRRIRRGRGVEEELKKGASWLKDERVGAQRSERERLGLTGTPRMEVEGEMD